MKHKMRVQDDLKKKKMREQADNKIMQHNSSMIC